MQRQRLRQAGRQAGPRGVVVLVGLVPVGLVPVGLVPVGLVSVGFVPVAPEGWCSSGRAWPAGQPAQLGWVTAPVGPSGSGVPHKWAPTHEAPYEDWARPVSPQNGPRQAPAGPNSPHPTVTVEPWVNAPRVPRVATSAPAPLPPPLAPLTRLSRLDGGGGGGVDREQGRQVRQSVYLQVRQHHGLWV